MKDLLFEKLSSDEFERLCHDILLRIDMGLKPVDGSGGDNGIDSFEDNKGTLHIFQYKNFTGRLEWSRKKQIKKSFDTALKKNPDMSSWSLLVPLIPTTGEYGWFKKEIEEKNKDIKVEIWSQSRIENELTKHDDLLNKYFHTSVLNCMRLNKEAYSFLAANGPLEKISEASLYIGKVNSQNPHSVVKTIKFDPKTNEKELIIEPKIDTKIDFTLDKSMSEALNKCVQEGRPFEVQANEIVNISSNNPDVPKKDQIMALKILPEIKHNKILMEIPDCLFYQEIDIEIFSTKKESAVLRTIDLPFEISLTLNKGKNLVHFNIKYDPRNKPVSEIVYYENFIQALNKSKKIIFRNPDSKEIYFIINSSDISLKTDALFFQVAKDLYVIEKYRGITFVLPKEGIPVKDYDNLQVVKSILMGGEHQNTFSDLRFKIDKKDAKDILSLYKNKKKIEKLRFGSGENVLIVLGKEIKFKEVCQKFPPLKLTNADEVESKLSEDIDEIELVLNPINPQDCYFVESKQYQKENNAKKK